MSTIAGPDGPYVQGRVLTPGVTDIIPAGDIKAHAFFGVIRDLLRASTVFRHEAALDAAYKAIDDFEKHILTGSHRSVVQETDPAPREDVTQRVPPQVGTAVVPAAGGLDYNRLAAAIVALQREEAARAQQEWEDATAQDGEVMNAPPLTEG